MKKVEANRYPHSATLFKFCKEALEIRYDGNVKVIDQDVGAILGYDPADCSHWKKGKKNIRSLTTLRNIADHLNVDETLLIDITSGKVSLDEAVFEYKGYGQFNINHRSMESLKKEYFKNPGKWQASSQGQAFEEIFDIHRYAVVQLAESIVARGQFTEAPIYIPEILRMFPAIQLVTHIEQDIPYTIRHEGEGRDLKTTIISREAETRPYIRFLASKALFKHLVSTQYQGTEVFVDCPAEVIEIQSNIFAGHLLIPGTMLRKEVDRLDSAFDILRQLAEIFWVSRSLMNQRLRDYLEFKN